MRAGGALLGIVLPGLALGLAVLIGRGLMPVDPASLELAPTDGTAPLTRPGIGRDVQGGRSFGTSFSGASFSTGGAGSLVVGLAVLATLLLVLSFTGLRAGEHTALLGGTPRAGGPTTTFDYLVKQLGFGLFPFSVVAFFALGRPLIRLDDEDGARTNPRLAFAQTYLLLFAGLGFALSDGGGAGDGRSALRGAGSHRPGDRRVHRRSAGGPPRRTGGGTVDRDRHHGDCA
jgi:hypothetical protein